MEKIAIDLLWVRPGKVGGTESFIRNLLDGFLELSDKFSFVLLVSEDNIESFRKYERDCRFQLMLANIKSKSIAKRIIWQNIFQNKFLRKHGIRKCFEPVYCKPWFNGGICYTCVIHDLQAYHYPEYHPFHEVVYSRLCWRMDILNADKIVAISQWVKSDIEQKYGRKNIAVIYNPISVKGEMANFDTLSEKYQIEQGQFYYTVSQMIPHKNLSTLVKMIEKILCKNESIPNKLVVSGISGNATSELEKMIKDKNLSGHVILTGYISNEERNALYKNCHTFLFPSVFEGFGMPPVEAMLFGTRVVTTCCTSLPEVTQGKAIYVDNPYDEDEWIEKIKMMKQFAEIDTGIYLPKEISKQYLNLLMREN